jgi:hypothetical protein
MGGQASKILFQDWNVKLKKSIVSSSTRRIKMTVKIARSPQPAALAVLRQATALKPNRNKASDGLLPSAAHITQSPNSDHNTGFAVDLTHDPRRGIDCFTIYEKLKADKRVKYLIFHGKIWSEKSGESRYTGSNQHEKHLHISIKDNCGKKKSRWFPWLGKAKTINKVKARIKSKPKKKEYK